MPAGHSGRFRRLVRRSEFIEAARGRRAGRSAFLLQAVPATAEDAGLGLTVTKKTGNAPERNRIKRRLRAAARGCASAFAPRHDYVLVGRREALSVPFSRLLADLSSALHKLHTTP